MSWENPWVARRVCFFARPMHWCVVQFSVPRVIVLLVGCSLLVPAAGCHREDGRNDQRIDALLDLYMSKDPGDRERAVAAFHELGDADIPHLEEVLRSRDGNSAGAMAALYHLGTERSVIAILQIVDGRTRETPIGGFYVLHGSLRKHDWTPERARAVPGLIASVVSFAKREKHGRERVCAMVADFAIHEAAPVLKEYTQDPDASVRKAAEDALLRLERAKGSRDDTPPPDPSG